MRRDPFAPGLLKELRGPAGRMPLRKVVVLRASRLGDFMCAIPAFRALRAALPEAELTIITLPILRDLAVRLPYFDRYAAFPGFPGIAEQFFEARRALDFFAHMQAEAFDLAVQMQGSGVNSNPFTLMLGARLTAGFVRQGDGAGRLDAALPLPEQGHEIRRMLALPLFLGAQAGGEHTEFPLWPEDHRAAEDLLAGAPRPLIGLHPGAREPDRRWPPERLGQAGAQLRRRYGGTVVVLGGAEEQGLAEAAAASAGEPCLNLAGRTELTSLGAVIARLSVLISNDSGPAHVAYALGTPSVAVFGRAGPERYGPLEEGPFRLALRPGGRPNLPQSRALHEVPVEQVVAAGQEVLRLPQAHPESVLG
jgi:ADP-heptose:LPS heptosyltransferase